MKGALLGLRDDRRRAERLAGPSLDSEMAIGRVLRTLRPIPVAKITIGCGRRSARTTSAAWHRPWQWPMSLAFRRIAYEFQMLYGMGDEFKDVLVNSAAACASTRRTVSFCPAWPTSSGGCWKTRPTNPFCAPPKRADIPEETLLMNPRATANQRQGLQLASLHHSIHSRFKNEPPTDFSRDDVRAKMQAAVDRVKGEFSRVYPLVINGEAITTSETVASLNPSHSTQVIGNVCKATTSSRGAGGRAANDAFPALARHGAERASRISAQDRPRLPRAPL